MKKLVQFCVGVLLGTGFAAQVAKAGNITINDTLLGAGTYFGGGPLGKGGEDQETEPNTVGAQAWDLEAFTLNGTSLKVYAGFNLLAGNQGISLGDLFIDVNGDAKWGATAAGTGGSTANNAVLQNSLFKYDYVIHFNARGDQSIGAGTYDVYSLSSVSAVNLTQVAFAQNEGSNPFTYASGGSLIGSGTMSVGTNPTSTLTLEDGSQITGGSHYIGDIDLSFLGSELYDSATPALFHLSMECGNDDLIGRVPVPDGGSALALLGLALGGLTFVGRGLTRKP